MKKGIFLILTLLVFSGIAAAAENGSGLVNRTIKGSVINISVTVSGGNTSFHEGGEFDVRSDAVCYINPCSLVEIYPLSCEGYNCSWFKNMDTGGNAGIYLKGDPPYKCLTVDRDANCSTVWRIKAKRAGMYKIAIMVLAKDTPTTYSDVALINIRGCGDGSCDTDESFTTCPQDCCERDCTSVADDVCHKSCDGINNCSLETGCDGMPVNYRSCISNYTFIGCCSAGTKSCGLGEYCLDASCKNCSIVCDGECQSAGCYGADPDCDRAGKPLSGCCGNNRVDLGEECDGDAAGTPCDGRCRGNCTCMGPTTTQFIPLTVLTTSSIPEITIQTTTTRNVEPVTMDNTSTLPGNSTASATHQEDLSLEFLVPAVLLIAAAAGGFFFIRKRGKKDKRSNDELMKEYEQLRQKESTLITSILIVKEKYASKELTTTDATGLIFDYEKELEHCRKKMEELEKNRK